MSDLLHNEWWRHSKVGAWMIGLSGRSTLKNELANYLSKGLTYYSEHVLINLLILEGKQAGTGILKFMERQVKATLKKRDFLNIDRLSIDWGIAILYYLDELYDSEYVKIIKTSNWRYNLYHTLEHERFHEMLDQILYPQTTIESIHLLMNRLKQFNL
ncbi:MAG: hypothetical protein AAF599_17390 [Bacteroidota bacterium]